MKANFSNHRCANDAKMIVQPDIPRVSEALRSYIKNSIYTYMERWCKLARKCDVKIELKGGKRGQDPTNKTPSYHHYPSCSLN